MEKGTRIGAHSIIRFARHYEQDLPVAIKFYADRGTFLHECELLSSGISVQHIPRVYQVRCLAACWAGFGALCKLILLLAHFALHSQLADGLFW